MRVSTVMMFERSVSSMSRQQGAFMEVGEQIASGKRVVRPSDDPQAASRAVGVSQSLATNAQQSDSRVTVRNSLSQEESVLDSVSDALTRAKELMIQAGNGTLSDADRQSQASELRGVYEALLGQANSTDGNGSYLFGGYKDSSAPFVQNDSGAVEYEGSDQVRQQKVDSSRMMEVGDTGKDVFQSVAAGSGYLAKAGDGNTGTLTFTGPQVTDTTADGYGSSYEISFSDNGDGTYDYTVKGYPDGDITGTYNGESGSLEFGGIRLTLEGTPEPSDTLAVGPAEDMDPDVFTTLENMLSALENPLDSDADKAAFANTLSTSSRELDNALDNVLTVRASVGARLNELDTLDTVGGDRKISYTQTQSDLIDLDYTTAISDYVLRQVGLQASQKAFVDLQGTSLFDLM
ncbi:flagellar hook-associated protein FlgL [Salinicola salarius]|uniref:flagellar hook-associated protein FlgL n=1 Tax=Salinicola salarius TaxID=430457 RepID=UPI000DA12463|nr:flagellar hook-associated protein FlgL [Salinicola salarius]MDF3917582.1 flagellar hook-associated protein FlgL [Salinicola salarius]